MKKSNSTVTIYHRRRKKENKAQPCLQNGIPVEKEWKWKNPNGGNVHNDMVNSFRLMLAPLATNQDASYPILDATNSLNCWPILAASQTSAKRDPLSVPRSLKLCDALAGKRDRAMLYLLAPCSPHFYANDNHDQSQDYEVETVHTVSAFLSEIERLINHNRCKSLMDKHPNPSLEGSR